MTIQLTPEQETLIEQSIRSGRLRSVDDLLTNALNELRHSTPLETHEPDLRRDSRFASLSDLLLNSPFAGAELDLERSRELPRSVDI